MYEPIRAPLSGEQHTKDRKLGFNPCSISYLDGGSYIAIGGSNREATLCTKARAVYTFNVVAVYNGAAVSRRRGFALRVARLEQGIPLRVAPVEAPAFA